MVSADPIPVDHGGLTIDDDGMTSPIVNSAPPATASDGYNRYATEEDEYIDERCVKQYVIQEGVLRDSGGGAEFKRGGGGSRVTDVTSDGGVTMFVGATKRGARF